MQIKDHAQYKKLIEIKELAKLTALNPVKILTLAKANKIPAVKIHNKFYCSRELLDRGLVSLSKTEPSLLSGPMRAYVYRLTHDSGYLAEALSKINLSESEAGSIIDPEEGMIAEWSELIEKKYEETINEIARIKLTRSSFKNFIFQLKQAVFFTSDKLEQAGEETLRRLSLRSYVVRMAAIGVFALIISIGLARFYPGLARAIAEANDKVFYAQADFIEKNIFSNLTSELASTESNLIIPDKEQLSAFIKKNSNKLFKTNSKNNNQVLITAEDIFGQVAGAVEKK